MLSLSGETTTLISNVFSEFVLTIISVNQIDSSKKLGGFVYNLSVLNLTLQRA